MTAGEVMLWAVAALVVVIVLALVAGIIRQLIRPGRTSAQAREAAELIWPDVMQEPQRHAFERGAAWQARRRQ